MNTAQHNGVAHNETTEESRTIAQRIAELRDAVTQVNEHSKACSTITGAYYDAYYDLFNPSRNKAREVSRELTAQIRELEEEQRKIEGRAKRGRKPSSQKAAKMAADAKARKKPSKSAVANYIRQHPGLTSEKLVEFALEGIDPDFVKRSEKYARELNAILEKGKTEGEVEGDKKEDRAPAKASKSASKSSKAKSKNSTKTNGVEVKTHRGARNDNMANAQPAA